MADERKIIIEIQSQEETTSTPAQQETFEQGVDTVKTVNQNKEAQTILITQAANQAKNLAIKAFNSTLNRYYDLKEDYMTENLVTNVSNFANKTVSLATTVVGGAMIGGPIGAGIAAVGWAASEGISAYNTFANTYQKIQTDNYNMVFTQTRAGLTNNSKGTEN